MARTTAGAAQRRGVRGRPVGLVEAAGGAVGQQDPGGGEVAGRVAGAHDAEVDDTAVGAVRGEDVGGVQVTVQPQRRACPGGRGDRVVPDHADRVRAGDQA